MFKRNTFRIWPVTGLAILWGQTVSGCAANGSTDTRTVGPEVIQIRLPTGYGRPRRFPVEFNHGKHARALEKKGCLACHVRDSAGKISLKMARSADPVDRDALMNLYHRRCIGCHQDLRASGGGSGPVACGQCHIRRVPPRTTRVAMHFDYSLHYRHVRAASNRCEQCHHVYDPNRKKLVYKKGKESACLDCHGEFGEQRKPSLRHASHRLCVNCHLERARTGNKSGPTSCVTCHDKKRQKTIKRVDNPPRLNRGQKDVIWITTPSTRAQAVAFDHKSHEATAVFCTTCHHKELKGCDKCHTTEGKKEGGRITLEAAFHAASSDRSCVGCHKTKSDHKDCAGCHRRMWNTPPRKRSCPTCHSGPVPNPDGEIAAQPTVLPAVSLASLPAASGDFPDIVVIKKLAQKFKPSRFPHRKIVARLDAAIRKSKLAVRFHGSTPVMCTGCHHNLPIGKRPTACGSCHGSAQDPATDKPGLKAAYHRQCIGCHREMKIAKQGCTDCHARAGKEGKK